MQRFLQSALELHTIAGKKLSLKDKKKKNHKTCQLPILPLPPSLSPDQLAQVIITLTAFSVFSIQPESFIQGGGGGEEGGRRVCANQHPRSSRHFNLLGCALPALLRALTGICRRAAASAPAAKTAISH